MFILTLQHQRQRRLIPAFSKSLDHNKNEKSKMDSVGKP